MAPIIGINGSDQIYGLSKEQETNLKESGVRYTVVDNNEDNLDATNKRRYETQWNLMKKIEYMDDVLGLQGPIRIRLYNAVKSTYEDVETIGDLVQKNPKDLLNAKRFGKTSLEELTKALKGRGLSFGMDVSKYGIESK